MISSPPKRRWPAKSLLLGCAIIFASNLAAGATGHRWVFFLGAIIALPMIGLGIWTGFASMNQRYLDELSRLPGHEKTSEVGRDKERDSGTL